MDLEISDTRVINVHYKIFGKYKRYKKNYNPPWLFSPYRESLIYFFVSENTFSFIFITFNRSFTQNIFNGVLEHTNLDELTCAHNAALKMITVLPVCLIVL